jgi:hypothetical protein
MRLKWAQQSPELQHLFPRVDPDPSGDGDGGGGDDEPLREPGKKALAAERQRAEDLEKKVTRLERQAKAFEGLNPDAYREALEKHRQAEERLQELETIANARAMEKEQTYTKQLQESKTREATLAKQLQEIQVKGAVRDAFLAIGGKREKDGAGRVPFDLFMAATGASYALDESGDVYVVDAKGAPVINELGRTTSRLLQRARRPVRSQISRLRLRHGFRSRTRRQARGGHSQHEQGRTGRVRLPRDLITTSPTHTPGASLGPLFHGGKTESTRAARCAQPAGTECATPQ